jgi:hypothetical protein
MDAECSDSSINSPAVRTLACVLESINQRRWTWQRPTGLSLRVAILPSLAHPHIYRSLYSHMQASISCSVTSVLRAPEEWPHFHPDSLPFHIKQTPTTPQLQILPINRPLTGLPAANAFPAMFLPHSSHMEHSRRSDQCF